MSFPPFETLRSKTIVLAQENIDTDQIIPARFLTTTSREGLGNQAFYDWRFNQDGSVRDDSPLDHLDASTHQILVGGANFGCGSSREHAPWALLDFGIRVVVSSDLADIFTSNCLKNGVLPVTVDQETHQHLLKTPGAEVTIDLAQQILTVGNHTIAFHVEPFARQCLMDGTDTLGALQKHLPAIEQYEKQHATR